MFNDIESFSILHQTEPIHEQNLKLKLQFRKFSKICLLQNKYYTQLTRKIEFIGSDEYMNVCLLAGGQTWC